MLRKNLRSHLAEVLSHTSGAIRSADVVSTLNVSMLEASKLLKRWDRGGWLCKVRRGLYLPVPLTSPPEDVVIEDPWQLATQTFAPCYIGGWSAAQHWDFTEQIFLTVVVISERHFDSKHQSIASVNFIIKEAGKTKFFGTKPLWSDGVKVLISDPTKTIIDLLDTPSLGGGIHSCADMLHAYLRSEHFDPDKLIEYGERMGNKTVFKRLGFLLENIQPDQYDLIAQCHKRISKGYTHLDPAVKEELINTRWRLRKPKNFRLQ